MVVASKAWKASTQTLIGLMVAVGGLFQVAEVHDLLIQLVHAHPHWSGVVGAVTAIAALLHNPGVQDALGIKRTVEVKTETVELAPADAEKSV